MRERGLVELTLAVSGRSRVLLRDCRLEGTGGLGAAAVLDGLGLADLDLLPAADPVLPVLVLSFVCLPVAGLGLLDLALPRVAGAAVPISLALAFSLSSSFFSVSFAISSSLIRFLSLFISC